MMLYLQVFVGLAIVAAVFAQDIVYPGSNTNNEINDSCVQPSGSRGICKLITDCPRVLQTLNVQYPKICGFHGRIPIVCCNQDNPIRVIDISPPTTNFDCGISSSLPSSFVRRERAIPLPDGEILASIEGVESMTNAWPWMALLQRQDIAGNRIWFCGGVLINEQWVLTAAHCTDRFNTTLVRLGEHDFSTDTDGVQLEDVGVADVIFHPGYKTPQAYHDISLIKLARSINIRSDISPVCLPWGHEADLSLEGSTVTITGWGSTRFFGDALSPFLNEIDVTVFPTDFCAKSYSTLSDYNENYPQSLGEESLCIGDNSDNNRLKDSCPGDSGGPAVLLRGVRYTMVGVVSKGFGCGKKDFPGIYVRVQDPEHLAWIKKVAFLS